MISLIVTRRASIWLIEKRTQLNVIDVGFVTDRDEEDSVVLYWNEYDVADATSWNMKYSCEIGKEKTRSASDYGSSKSIGAEEDDEKKKEKDNNNDDGGLQVYYLDVSHVPVDVGTLQSYKISWKRIWMMYEDEERGGGSDTSIVNWGQIASSSRERWNCRNLMRSLDWVPIDSLQDSTRPMKK